MTYTLELNLTGADKVQGAISALNTLKSGGGISGAFAGSGGGGNVLGKQADDISRLVRQVEAGKVGVHALGRELKNLGQNMGSGASAWLSAGLGSKSAAFKALNPGLANIVAGLVPPQAIRGLRDIGGRDLAKVFSMGSFNNAISASSIASQGKPPVLGGSGNSFSLSSIPFIGKFLTVVGLTALAMEALRKAIQTVSAAINRGFGIYSGAGQAGLSAQFFTQRNALASIFGITGNPNQVFMFGKAVTDIANRIRQSSTTLAETSPALAQIHINFDILKLDFSAFASTLAYDIAPALDLFLGALDGFVKGLVDYVSLLKSLPFMTAAQGLAAFAMVSASTLGRMAKGATEAAQGLPTLHPLMRQLPTSSLEKMGLLIGGSFNNPVVRQLQTANQHLKKIADIVSGQNGVPRARQFGLAGNVNNP